MRDEKTLAAILLFIDDITRIARRRVIVNHLGPFGAVTMAAGADIWATDYYLSRRRLRLTDLADSTGGSQMPRYFSPALIGDIGVQSALDAVVKVGMFDKVKIETEGAKELHQALAQGKPASAVYAWQYEKTRTTASKAHYLEAMNRVGRRLANSSPPERIVFVHKWLRKAVAVADALKTNGISDSYVTELGHQRSWLAAFERLLERRSEGTG